VREFDHFGDCFCTCALIIWTVLLHRTPLPHLLRFRLVRTSSRGSSWSFRGSSLRCRGSRQPPSSSILSSCDTLSLLGYLHHRLSLLQHYNPVDFRVRDSRAFSLSLPSSRCLRRFSPRATLLFRRGSLHQLSPNLTFSRALLSLT
jgi:hypothetical protein